MDLRGAVRGSLEIFMPEPQETERAIGGVDPIGSRILPTGLLYAHTFSLTQKREARVCGMQWQF
jgi:hypothetical protein